MEENKNKIFIDNNIISSELYSKDGIWYSKKNTIISYPDDGNDNCLILEESSFWFRHRNNCITEAIKKFSSPVIFDVGGGNGYVSKGMADAGFKVVLLEPGERGVQNAKKRGIENIICSTLENTGFCPKTIPSIGMFDVLEHIENDLNFLSYIKDLLILNGRLYITVPAYWFLWSLDDDATGHFRRYTIRQLSKKLKSIGFEIEYSTYFFSILPLPIFFFRTLPNKLGLKKSKSPMDQHLNLHREKKGIINIFLNILLNIELKLIKKQKRLWFGGSCLIVAKSK